MITLRLYDRNGTTLLGLLPQPISWGFSVEFNEVGALQLEYPSDGINADQLLELREIAVVAANGTEVTNGRFVITNISRDRIASTGSIQLTAKSILWRLDTALIYPDGGIAGGTTKRNFTNAKAGAILKTVIDAAQTRGALSGLTYTFTNTNDSNSVAWSGSTTGEFAARTTILSILRSLSDLGMVEVETNGRQLKATNADGIGTDKTTGNSPVVLRYGFNVGEAPEQLSADQLASVALVEGDNDLILERSNATALSTYGRLESAFTASGVADTAVVQSLSDSFLEALADPDRQLTVGLSLQEGSPQPFADFKPGDYVYTATSAGLERVRVRQLTLSMSGGAITATATLGDRIYENDIRIARRIAAITANSQSVSNGELPESQPDITEDTLAPKAPTSITGSSVAYLDIGVPRALVTLSWTAPTQNADNTPLDDLREYEIFQRIGASDPWVFASSSGTTNGVVANLAPGTLHRFQVFAIDSSNNRSAASAEFTITTATSSASLPVGPSTPTLSTRLGTLTIAWNGLNSSGGAMAVNFSYLEVHVSTGNNFTPTSGTRVARMTGADKVTLADLAYNTTYYVKFVAYSTSGVATSASAQASVTITPLVNADLIGQVIAGANIQNGTITASDKIIGNTITGGLIQSLAITSDKIASNAITTDKLAAGSVTASIIAAGSIDAAKIVAGGITANIINGGSISASSLTIDSSIYQLRVATSSDFAYINVQPGSNLGVALNAVGFVSTDTSGWISACYPYTDNNRNLGRQNFRWGTVFAATGTINTSDSRLKTDVEDASLGLDFIKALRPVSYRWIEGGKEFVRDEEGGILLDENGLPSSYSIPGVRTHWGLIAQQVKEVLEDLEAPDFAGFVIDDLSDPDSTMSLRYSEFISPLIKAVQELADRIEILEAN